MDSKNWKQQLLRKLNSCSPDRFKDTMLSLLKEAGFRNVQVTGSEDDMVEATGVQWKGLLGFDTSILCLRNVEELRSDVLDEFLRHFDHGREERVCGLLVTTAAVDGDMAEKAARETGGLFEVTGGDELCDALQESGQVSLRTRTVEDVEFDLGRYENDSGRTNERETVAAKQILPEVLTDKEMDGSRLRDLLETGSAARSETRKRDGRTGQDNSGNWRSNENEAKIFSEHHQGVSAVTVFVLVFEALIERDSEICEKLMKDVPGFSGTVRNVFGKSREEVNPRRPINAKRLSNGLYICVQYTNDHKHRLIEEAVSFAGHSFGKLGEGRDVEIDF